ncbi:hypothetical protein MIR68_001975 [Amoeboaphelidium protococcarum]|nr:hypothetical protein MIR68_001975 [Amoeboaphelidium protococcarum]
MEFPTPAAHRPAQKARNIKNGTSQSALKKALATPAQRKFRSTHTPYRSSALKYSTVAQSNAFDLTQEVIDEEQYELEGEMRLMEQFSDCLESCSLVLEDDRLVVADDDADGDQELSTGDQKSLLAQFYHLLSCYNPESGDGVTEQDAAYSQEKQFWSLLHDLLLVRQMQQQQDQPDKQYDANVTKMGGQYIGSSDRSLVHQFYNNNSSVMEKVIVKEWLERTHKFHLDQQQQQQPFQSQNGSLLMYEGFGSQQQSNANAQNITPQQSMQNIWNMIRSGRFTDAIAFCREQKLYWLCASLNGALYNGIEQQVTDVDTSMEDLYLGGNANRKQFLGVCQQIASSSHHDVYVRAIYASLCGDLYNMLLACQNWQDALWCMIQASLVAETEQFLSQSHGLAGHSVHVMSLLDMVGVLRQLYPQSRDAPFPLLFQSLIENNLSIALEYVMQLHRSPSCDKRQFLQVLRVAVHWIIAEQLPNLKLCTAELSQLVIGLYVEQLLGYNKVDLVLDYISKVGYVEQTKYAGRMLLSLVKMPHKEKVEMFQYMVLYGLDAKAACRVAFALAFENKKLFIQKIIKGIDQAVDDLDMKMIDAALWMFADDSMDYDALLRVNQLLRYFLMNGDVNAANGLVNKVKEVLPTFASLEYMQQLDRNHADKARIYQKELLCYLELIQALSVSQQWNQDVGAALQMLKLNKISWSDDMNAEQLTVRAETACLQCLIQNQEEAWLTGVDGVVHSSGNIDGDEENQKRQEELDTLRRMYIPLVVDSLSQLYKLTINVMPQNLEKCLELCNLVASEEYRLYTWLNHSSGHSAISNHHNAAVRGDNTKAGKVGVKSPLEQLMETFTTMYILYKEKIDHALL